MVHGTIKVALPESGVTCQLAEKATHYCGLPTVRSQGVTEGRRLTHFWIRLGWRVQRSYRARTMGNYDPAPSRLWFACRRRYQLPRRDSGNCSDSSWTVRSRSRLLGRSSLDVNAGDQARHDKRDPAHNLYDRRWIVPRLRRTFVSRDRPYFKFDVDFQAVGDEDGRATLVEDGRYVNRTISRPYLQFTIAD